MFDDGRGAALFPADCALGRDYEHAVGQPEAEAQQHHAGKRKRDRSTRRATS
jgi:hypothetical protein